MLPLSPLDTHEVDMKFATYHDGTRDGQLWVVSRDLRRAVPATGIAPSLLAALEDWDGVMPRLLALSERLNAADEPLATRFAALRLCRAPRNGSMPRPFSITGG